MRRPPPSSPLFPYTTLFRSAQGALGGREGFEFGLEPAGNQSLCPPQLNYLEFLSQASTESQGPWDSNYQVEDDYSRSEEHTSELQSHVNLVCRLLLEKKKKT